MRTYFVVAWKPTAPKMTTNKANKLTVEIAEAPKSFGIQYYWLNIKFLSIEEYQNNVTTKRKFYGEEVRSSYEVFTYTMNLLAYSF